MSATDNLDRNSPRLQRRAAVVRMLQERGDALVVAGLGSAAYDLYAAGDTPLNFYLWGAMGGAAMLGLGLALAQPRRRVVVLTGDGEMLMGLGSLATIAVARPANLALIVLDNEHYGETGMQPSASARGADLAAIAAAAGFGNARAVHDEAQLDALADELFSASGPLFAVLKIATDPNPPSLPPRDGPMLRSRLRSALLGPAENQVA